MYRCARVSAFTEFTAESCLSVAAHSPRRRESYVYPLVRQGQLIKLEPIVRFQKHSLSACLAATSDDVTVTCLRLRQKVIWGQVFGDLNSEMAISNRRLTDMAVVSLSATISKTNIS